MSDPLFEPVLAVRVGAAQSEGVGVRHINRLCHFDNVQSDPYVATMSIRLVWILAFIMAGPDRQGTAFAGYCNRQGAFCRSLSWDDSGHTIGIYFGL
jgi:hypothetical protein